MACPHSPWSYTNTFLFSHSTVFFLIDFKSSTKVKGYPVAQASVFKVG
jgi:hypothetical protein